MRGGSIEGTTVGGILDGSESTMVTVGMSFTMEGGMVVWATKVGLTLMAIVMRVVGGYIVR